MAIIKIKVKKKKKKEKYKYNKIEILFNLLSIAIVFGVGIYFGTRALYYYSRQNVKMQEEAKTLNGMILNNNKIVDGDGLHQDSNGYYFKGKSPNNYVRLFNRMYRAVRVNNDNSVLLISEEVVSSFMWGEEEKYENSNVRNWITKTKLPHSGIYYDTIPSIKDFLVDTTYQLDKMLDDKIEFGDQKMKDMISILGLDEYVLASGKNSYLNIGKAFYLLGIDEDGNYLYVDEDGNIQTIDSYSGYGIRPVFTLKSNTSVISGVGSLEDPYVIDQGGKTNLIDSYVKLGSDIWKIYQEDNGVLRLYLNDYIKTPEGVEVNRYYSKYNSLYDITESGSLSFYLNNIYLSGLTYKDYLLDTSFFLGEISDDSGYSFENIYTRPALFKVGLLNIFDYHSNFDQNNYFYMNVLSEVGNMQYTTINTGFLVEEDVRDEKHIVPVVSINKAIIKNGVGSIDNPFVVE